MLFLAAINIWFFLKTDYSSTNKCKKLSKKYKKMFPIIVEPGVSFKKYKVCTICWGSPDDKGIYHITYYLAKKKGGED